MRHLACVGIRYTVATVVYGTVPYGNPPQLLSIPTRPTVSANAFPPKPAHRSLSIMLTDGPTMADTPTLERSFRGHKDTIASVCFNPNMKQLVSGGHDSCVMVWNFRLQLRAFRFVGHKAPVLSVAAAPSGNLVASGSKDRSIRLWIPTVKGECTSLKAHMAPVRSVTFSSDGQSIASASDDKTVKVWGIPGQRFQYSLSGHSNWVRCAKFSPDGTCI